MKNARNLLTFLFRFKCPKCDCSSFEAKSMQDHLLWCQKDRLVQEEIREELNNIAMIPDSNGGGQTFQNDNDFADFEFEDSKDQIKLEISKPKTVRVKQEPPDLNTPDFEPMENIQGHVPDVPMELDQSVCIEPKEHVQAHLPDFPMEPVVAAVPTRPSTPTTSNSRNSAPGESGGGGSLSFMGGTQMAPNTAKHKCKNFLATLLKLASEQPANMALNIRQLIQGLIDGKVEPETFITKLQREPQPHLIPFLKRSLPYLQASLISGELTIEGVNAPPRSSTRPSTSTTFKSSNSAHGGSGGGGGLSGMGGGQIAPETPKLKCQKFLATLLKLASEQPANVALNVRKLIQGLIDGKVEPETFTTKLQRDLKSSPQPCLIPFLKRSLPYLQASLIIGELTIEGINAPPRGVALAVGLNRGTTTEVQRPATAVGVRPTLVRTGPYQFTYMP